MKWEFAAPSLVRFTTDYEVRIRSTDYKHDDSWWLFPIRARRRCWMGLGGRKFLLLSCRVLVCRKEGVSGDSADGRLSVAFISFCTAMRTWPVLWVFPGRIGSAVFCSPGDCFGWAINLRAAGHGSEPNRLEPSVMGGEAIGRVDGEARAKQAVWEVAPLSAIKYMITRCKRVESTYMYYEEGQSSWVPGPGADLGMRVGVGVGVLNEFKPGRYLC